MPYQPRHTIVVVRQQALADEPGSRLPPARERTPLDWAKQLFFGARDQLGKLGHLTTPQQRRLQGVRVHVRVVDLDIKLGKKLNLTTIREGLSAEDVDLDQVDELVLALLDVDEDTDPITVAKQVEAVIQAVKAGFGIEEVTGMVLEVRGGRRTYRFIGVTPGDRLEE